MKRTTCAFALFAIAQLPAPAAQPDPPVKWSIGPVKLSGLVDGYYGYNFNHPASRDNQLRNFDVKSGRPRLSMAALTFEYAPEPLGFRVDLGYGRAFEIINGAGRNPAAFRYIGQAYASWKPPRARGLQLDFGKFVTSAGAEVIETHQNWNYSRSLLFALAVPYFHFGLRATVPLGASWSAGAYLVNGWNNVRDNNNGKTLGFTGAFKNSALTWTHTYHIGPEKPGPARGLRTLYDTTLLLTPAERVSMYVNFDYGMDRTTGGASARWTGVAGAARFALSERFALAPRLEWFDDASGFATGTAQKLKEFTMTAEFKPRGGVLTRLEYRRDWSNTPFFDRGADLAASKSQTTVLLGLVAHFGARR